MHPMCATEDKRPYPVSADRIAEVRREADGSVTVTLEGIEEPVREVRVRRCFPWSLRDRYVAILDKDGKEVTLLRGLDDLPAGVRDILTEELHDKIFNPRIRSIRKHNSEFGVMSFEVETDRGDVAFQVRTRDDIRMLSGGQMLLRDVDGNTYEIPDLAALDPASRRLIHEYA